MVAPETRELLLAGDLRVQLHLNGEETDGAFCLLVDHPQPGWSLPPHRHRNEAETMYVLEGEFSVTVGGRERVLGPGATAHVPRGVVHSGGNVGETKGRRVLIFSPAGIEGFFIEADIRSGQATRSTAEQLAIAQRYGWEFEPAE